jgi:formyl-CoA transferase
LRELPIDERYATNARRLKHRESLVRVLQERFRRRTRSEWLADLEAAGVPCGPIQSIPQALDDPHIRARRMTFSLSHSSGATAPQVANPIKFSRNTIDYRRAPPVLGEHTEEVLANELGWSTERIAALRSRGAI